MAYILSALMIFAMIPAQTALAATEPSISLGSATLTGGKYYYEDATVSGTGIQTILINFSDDVTSGDAITLPVMTPDGFTVSGNSYSKRINVDTSTTGLENASAVQDYVRDIGFAIAGTTQTVNVTVTTQNIAYDTFYNIDTQHYYQFITYASGTTGTWTGAYGDVKLMTYMGRTGYLATVKNLAEDQFLYELSSGATGWLGGTTLTPGTQSGKYYESFNTSSNVDHWYWGCGPEIGNTFYTAQVKSTTNDSNSVNAGYYFNWGASEPNCANTEQCLTTLVVAPPVYDHTEKGYHDTVFSWNNLAYNSGYASNGCYYPKGYFVEYGDKATGDNTTGTVVTGYASDKGTLHAASDTSLTINTYTDDVSADVSDSVELRQDGSTIATATHSGTGYYSVSTTLLTSENTYEIYIDDMDTGKSITYNGSAVSIDVDYYTVTFAVSDAREATGSTISATAGDSEITSIATVLSGETVIITATGAGADSYDYLWSGDGTNEETTASLTISSLSGAVDATCTVTGTIIPMTLELDDPLFSTDTNYSFPELTLTSSNNIGVVTIHADKAAASGNTITLPTDADTPGGAPTVITDLNNLTKTIVFSSAQSAASVQAYLRTVVFTASPDGPQTVTITADANTTTGLGSDMKLTAFYDHPDGTTHYYVYVSSSLVTWVDSYNAAKSMTFMGMKGYLPTISSPEENAVLTNISTDAAWSGGTRLVFNGGNSTTDGTQICDQSTLNINSFTKADADEKSYFYWACGPEAGLAYSTGKTHSDSGFGLIDTAFETVFSTSAWGNNQPDNFAYYESTTEPCMQVNQQNTVSGSTVYLWNDLPLFRDNDDDELRYYFVEFGGYTGSTDSIKQVANDPGSPDASLTASASAEVTASYTITYNLDDGTNPDEAPTSYTYGTGAALPTPTKTGYNFGGWYTMSDLSGSAAPSIGTADTGAKEYWAKWTAASYSITYNLDGGTNPDGAPASYTYETGATLPTPTKAGYRFGGWYTASDLSGSTITIISTTDTGDKIYYAKWTAATSSGGNSPTRTITVTETSSDLFAGSSGDVLAEANMNNAFSSSVEVKVTDTTQEGASFGFGAGTNVYPFDISLYIKGTNTKTEPASGYAVTISLPIPEDLLDARDHLSIVHKSDDGTVTTLASSLKQVGGVWYLVFNATEFSPYALVVSNLASYDTAAGLPYYLDNSGGKVFIGFAANGKYLAPDGETVLFTPNPKSFTDISSHWGKTYIDFVTEREIFVGTGTNTFSPDTGMTRAMFATVIGRLYERSYGEISISDACAFTDCNYDDYYGKYVDWAAENGIIQGVGGGLFQPDRQVSRQEMAAMLYRFAEFMQLSTNTSTDTLNYSDALTIASWAEDAALYCQKTEIITGRTGGSFAPAETATRAEVAAIIQRFVELAVN